MWRGKKGDWIQRRSLEHGYLTWGLQNVYHFNSRETKIVAVGWTIQSRSGPCEGTSCIQETALSVGLLQGLVRVWEGTGDGGIQARLGSDHAIERGEGRNKK